MHARLPLRVVAVALLALVTTAAPPAVAQPDTDAGTRAALAAITLTGDELPSSYTLKGEAFVGAEGGPAGAEVPPAFADAGFQGTYLSSYEAEDGSGTITSYASAWTDASAAETGFGLLENVDGETDEPLEAGSGSAELTVTDDGFDATFVVDRFVVGVEMQGGPIGEQDIDALVGSLEERANAVTQGAYPAGTDGSIPGAMIDTRALGTELRAGFLSASEAEQLYGLTGSSLGGVQASWVSLTATGADASAPYIAVALSTFVEPDNAARVVEQAEQLVPVALEMAPLDGVTVEGADLVRAFAYTSVGADAPDSVRVVAQVGAQVTVVDVQGAASVEAARDAAESLATAQVACMGGSCALPEISLGG